MDMAGGNLQSDNPRLGLGFDYKVIQRAHEVISGKPVGGLARHTQDDVGPMHVKDWSIYALETSLGSIRSGL